MAKADLKKKGKALVIPATKEDKKKALESALAQIEKNYGKGAVIKLGANTTMPVDSIPTGSMGLDMALGIGGVPKGRIVELYGPESSGKTTVALHVIAEAQKLGGEVAFVDVEHALDPKYAAALRFKCRSACETDVTGYEKADSAPFKNKLRCYIY